MASWARTRRSVQAGACPTAGSGTAIRCYRSLSNRHTCRHAHAAHQSYRLLWPAHQQRDDYLRTEARMQGTEPTKEVPGWRWRRWFCWVLISLESRQASNKTLPPQPQKSCLPEVETRSSPSRQMLDCPSSIDNDGQGGRRVGFMLPEPQRASSQRPIPSRDERRRSLSDVIKTRKLWAWAASALERPCGSSIRCRQAQ
ncbi:hypothetical protein CCHR01_07983 [Colletotrichum chrysophilum]|uniref:Uncharacterized protein n=1 Tax=Colletotrichum chrysophilum TaxID=1836956 RepID=A0AAD9AJU4_9PEZI|nr:hypothetical protein CCHR01_07983 [Colletotrichum chrysophilum]